MSPASAGGAASFLAMPENIKRMLLQAVFEKIWIVHGANVGWTAAVR